MLRFPGHRVPALGAALACLAATSAGASGLLGTGAAPDFMDLAGPDPGRSCPAVRPLDTLLGAPVDPAHVTPEADLGAAHRAYMDQVSTHEGGAGFAPLGELSPEKPLLLIVPGHGRTFRDLAGLRELSDDYSLLVTLYDAHDRQLESAGRIADALIRVAPALREALGPGALDPLRIVGHSMGATVTPLVVDALREREAWGSAVGPRGHLVLLDGPWRGVDVPWLARLPVVNRIGGWILGKNPLKPVDGGEQSVANASPSMQAVEAFAPPPGVAVDLVTVRNNPEFPDRFKHYAPVNSWFPEELPDDEVGPLLEVLLTDGAADDDLAVWTLPLWNRKVGLRHLMRALRLDQDYPRRFAFLRQQMREVVGPAGLEDPGGAVREHREELLRLYEDALLDVVDAFEGKHTEFMWEDPRFLPRLRTLLERSDDV